MDSRVSPLFKRSRNSSVFAFNCSSDNAETAGSRALTFSTIQPNDFKAFLLGSPKMFLSENAMDFLLYHTFFSFGIAKQHHLGAVSRNYRRFFDFDFRVFFDFFAAFRFFAMELLLS